MEISLLWFAGGFRLIEVDVKKLPLLQALLVADHVYRDSPSGKHVVCGIFNTAMFIPRQVTRESPEKPDEPAEEMEVSITKLVRAGSPFAYVSLTELQGELELELRYVALVDDSVLFKTNFRVRCDDPIRTVEFALRLPELPRINDEESTYALELVCENHLLGAFRILMQPQHEAENES
ncbi:MAG: hypothetical protein JWP89_2726 [Schlesneria sp.]|nr:hypothetical protein [Schlesneria sp.]